VNQVTRRLAAILVADVAGYSRLMASDNAGTLAHFNALRTEVIDPAIARYNGRVVGSAGDSLLVEFASAVEAVRCAVEVQAGLAARNAGLPGDWRIDFRMDINLGDIIADGDTIHGDGVNIAARLEKLAELGSVTVSQGIHDQVKGKLPYAFVDLGEHSVKNIAEPVRAYRVTPEDVGTASRGSMPRRRRPARHGLVGVLAIVLFIIAAAVAAWFASGTPESTSGPPAVAVLPLANLSGDPALDPLAEGMTEGLIARFARSPLVRAIARTTTDAYKGEAADIRAIGREIGARYILEGSVQSGDGTTRDVAQLIDALDGSHVWAEHFDSTVGDAIAVQDDVIERIVTELAGTGGLIDQRQYDEAWAKDEKHLGEYDYSLRGQDLLNQHEIERAIALLTEGLERPPDSSLLRARLGYGYLQRAVEGLNADVNADFEAAYRLGQEAVPDATATTLAIGVGHALLSELSLNYMKDIEQALREREKALQIFGSDYGARVELSYVLLVAGRPEETIASLQGLTPEWPFADWGYTYLSWAYFATGDHERAIAAAITNPTPSPTYSMAFLLASQVELSRLDEAKRTVEKIRSAVPAASLAMFRALHFTRTPGVLERELATLAKAGLPD